MTTEKPREFELRFNGLHGQPEVIALSAGGLKNPREVIHVIERSYARELEDKLNAYISAVDKFNNLWLEHGCTTNTRSCLLCKIHGLIHDSLDKALSGETKE